MGAKPENLAAKCDKYEKAMGWLPSWVGLVLGLAAGAALIIGGAVTESPVWILGIWAVAAMIISTVDGARQFPHGSFSKKSFGALVCRVGTVAWAIIAILLAAAIVVVLILGLT